MFSALEDRSLDGILLDSFVAGANRHLISSNVRVNKIISYDSSYGIVFREKMASQELKACFNNYYSDKKGEISTIVDDNTSPVEVNEEIFQASVFFETQLNLASKCCCFMCISIF